MNDLSNIRKILIICGAVLGTGLIWYYLKHPLVTKIQVGRKVFIAELAVTNIEKEKGLGYRDKLQENKGMLFTYDHSEKYSFWMKGMRFPIDILWIRDGKIVDITKNAPIATTSMLPTYSPSEPVNQVLEINAGISEREGITIGDSAIILH